MVHQSTDHCVWNWLESVRGAPYELSNNTATQRSPLTVTVPQPKHNPDELSNNTATQRSPLTVTVPQPKHNPDISTDEHIVSCVCMVT